MVFGTACRNGPRDAQRFVKQSLDRHHALHETDLLRASRVDRFAGEKQLAEIAFADPVHQHATDECRQQSAASFGKTDLRIGRRDHNVAGGH